MDLPPPWASNGLLSIRYADTKGPVTTALRPLVLFLCLLICGHETLAQDVKLPDIGDPASSVMSPSQEALLGETLLREIRRNLPLLDDPQLDSYINSLGYRLVSGAPDSRQDFTFLIVNDPAINAFAMPGGIVAINTGLILTAEDEAEVAAVVAHEIAHVTQRHLARMYAKSDDMSLATGLAILAAIIASAYDSQLGQAALYGTLAAGAQSQINFTRSNEQEADRTGIQTLANAGFDPHAMPSFFDKLQRHSFGSSSSITDYLRTHPVTASRISDSAARADQMTGNFERNSIEFKLMQARLRVLTETPKDSVERLEATPIADGDLVRRYEYGLALTLADRGERATEILRQPATRHPDLLPLQLAYADALKKAGHAGEALQRLRRLNDLFPQQEPVAIPLARLLIESGKAQEANAVMDPIVHLESPTPLALKTRAEAADAAGEKALSHETLADYYIAFGQFAPALKQLDLALKVRGLDNVTEARLRDKREKLLSIPSAERRAQ